MRALLLLAVAVHGEPFAMKYVAEIGHLDGKSVALGAATARGLADGDVRITGRDRAAKPWSLRFTPDGGAGWTTVWSADFDADGQPDLMIARLKAFNGMCNGAALVTLLLFDRQGRPVPSQFHSVIPRHNTVFPYLPVTANRVGGRAEVVIESCDGALSTITPRVDNPPRAAERIDLLDTQMPLPDGIVLDGPAGREIVFDRTFSALLRVMRSGAVVNRTTNLFWADLNQPAAPQTIVAHFEVSERTEFAVTPKPAPGGCFTITIEWALHMCPKTGLWRRTNGGTQEELLADRQTVRSDHTAMGHTVRGSRRYPRPGVRGVVPVEDGWELIQWAGGFMLIKDGVFDPVALPYAGTLVRIDDGIGFLDGDRVLAVRGRFVWRR